MPTVLKFGGLRVAIFPNDHRPAHVHVNGGDGEAVFNLNCPDGPAAIRESYGFKQSELSGIRDVLNGALDVLCAKWSVTHGRY